MTELQPYIDKAIKYGICDPTIKELKKYETIKEFLEYSIYALQFCYWYARYVLKDRFELGEKTIARDFNYSYWYARDILEDRFELGEKAIARDEYYLLLYNDFIRGLDNERI